MARFSFSLLLEASAVASSLAFCPSVAFTQRSPRSLSTKCQATISSDSDLSRRELFVGILGTAAAASIVGAAPQEAHAIGPVKINLLNPTYSAKPCPKDKPIPGEKAMKGMKGLCVTVTVDLENAPEKLLELVGVYGFVTAGGSGESVLANNPDGGSDAGQFAMVEEVKPGDKKLQFEFVAAVPQETVSLSYACLNLSLQQCANLFYHNRRIRNSTRMELDLSISRV
jgi:hypothetical protein